MAPAVALGVVAPELALELVPRAARRIAVAHMATQLPPRAINLWGPGLFYLVLLLVIQLSPLARAATLLPADPDHHVALALLLSLIGTAILYRAQGLRLGALTHAFLLGCGRLLPAALLLALVWAFDSALVTLGLFHWLAAVVPILPVGLWPLLLLLSAALLARGSASLFFPLAMLWPFGLGMTSALGAPLPLSLAALLSGAAFGLFTRATWPNDFLVDGHSGLWTGEVRPQALAAMTITILLLLLATHVV